MNSAPPEPSTKRKSFACPHCHAHADQAWLLGLATPVARATGNDDGLPSFLDVSAIEKVLMKELEPKQRKDFERLRDAALKAQAGKPGVSYTHEYLNEYYELSNIHLSRCYSCRDYALWLNDRLIYPAQPIGPGPNADLPDEIKGDVDEARTILDLSPRGAAALLRLAVQKVCIHLGYPGKDLNADIGAMVARGLDPDVQKALDSVRVVGNEAVHPGQLDIDDDRETVLRLLHALNFIAERLITQPRKIKELFGQLPQSKVDGIVARDTKAAPKGPD